MPTQPFSVMGGSGVYAGASGTGRFDHASRLRESDTAVGTEKWAGTLAVRGLNFDLTTPVLTGAVDKRVRAPREGAGRKVRTA